VLLADKTQLLAYVGAWATGASCDPRTIGTALGWLEGKGLVVKVTASRLGLTNKTELLAYVGAWATGASCDPRTIGTALGWLEGKGLVVKVTA
jgi:hypothetical protein